MFADEPSFGAILERRFEELTGLAVRRVMHAFRVMRSVLRRDLPRVATNSAQDEGFRLLAESSKDVIFRLDPQNRPVYVSPSVEELLGWTPEEMKAGGAAFIHPDDQPMIEALHHRLICGELREAVVQVRMVDREGQTVWTEASARLIRDADGRSGDVVMVMRGISDRKQLEDELRLQAQTDGLTGLLNRRAFDAALEREWSEAGGKGGNISLMLIDVDHFKKFNDHYGHQAGDECLKVIAAAISDVASPSSPAVARYGGEEIAVILPAVDAGAAIGTAEAIREHVERLAIHHPEGANDARTVTLSIGVATAFARPGAAMHMPAGLILAADNALYTAKREGRNSVRSTVLLTSTTDRS